VLLRCYEECDEAFLSRTVTGDETCISYYTSDLEASSLSSQKFKIVLSPGKVMATVFWDVHRVLMVNFTPPSSTADEAACQEAQATPGGYLMQEKDC
jgi:hypothetical protein